MGERGAAVLLILLVLLALTALGHASFLVAIEEGAASRASVAVLQARLLAEGGVRRTLRLAGADTLPAGGSRPVLLAEGGPAGARYRVELRWLSREIAWFEGHGFAAAAAGGPERVTDRVARLAWALSPLERLAAFVAAVEHGGAAASPSGTVETLHLRDAGALASPRGCRDLTAELDSLPGTLHEAVWVLPSLEGRLPELGRLAHDSLLARIPRRTGEVVTPSPEVREGRCLLESSTNWGSPAAPEAPCGGHRPAVAAEGDLTLVGGEGQGLLLVTGDLRLAGGARYAGLILVGGDLVLEAGAVLEGVVRVRGSFLAAEGARLAARWCPALLALEAAPALRRPLPLPASGWIRPL